MPKFQKLLGSTHAAINALIIYDDFTFAARANATLQRSAHHLDMSIKWNVRPWRLDMLKFPPTAEEALNEAIDAHLIVFAGVTAKPLPAWLNDWLEHWAKCRRIDEAALAIIDDGNKHTSSPSTISEMSLFAKRRGLGFIVSDLTAAESDLSFSVHSMPEYKLSLLTIQPSPVTTSAHQSYHHWGIND
jgi:hypothetical protein